MTIINDDRSEAQKLTHTILVVGTDSFMSHWGAAANGASYAAWACTGETVDKVLAWVKSRGDMKRVRVVNASGYKPACAHMSIYPVTEGHRALEGRVA